MITVRRGIIYGGISSATEKMGAQRRRGNKTLSAKGLEGTNWYCGCGCDFQNKWEHLRSEGSGGGRLIRGVGGRGHVRYLVTGSGDINTLNLVD